METTNADPQEYRRYVVSRNMPTGVLISPLYSYYIEGFSVGVLIKVS